MTRSKPISMKKLYKWSEDFIKRTNAYRNKQGFKPFSLEEEMAVSMFINHVVNHRND